MIKKKSSRILITLECQQCRLINHNGVSRYLTSKNRKNNPKTLQLKKYCQYCNTHILHKELK